MSVCEICGATENLCGHHESYEPEIINILCRSCHMKEHQKPTTPHHPNKGKYNRFLIVVSPETWKALNSMKKPGESFDSVLKRIISVTKEGES